MTKEEYLKFCRGIKGAVVDCPFRPNKRIPETYIARHKDTKRWFAAIMELEEKEFVNLKCDPEKSGFLRDSYEGITAGYHMNKEHWNSVYLASDVPEEIILELTMESFALTESGKRHDCRKRIP